MVHVNKLLEKDLEEANFNSNAHRMYDLSTVRVFQTYMFGLAWAARQLSGIEQTSISGDQITTRLNFKYNFSGQNPRK